MTSTHIEEVEQVREAYDKDVAPPREARPKAVASAWEAFERTRAQAKKLPE